MADMQGRRLNTNVLLLWWTLHICFGHFTRPVVLNCVCKTGKKKRLLSSSCLSVRPSVYLSAWNNSAPTGRILMQF